ncbi:MAG: hypothetical protein M1824_006081 [Vezdaea acicularis]|nr:MAG: hypothetical protein M1824_006081 [Vezdaea acicularis]
MNAHAHLVSQGWAGTGNALPSTSGTGLTRPLLVSRKENSLGVGKKKFDVASQWWLKAFDEGLRGLNAGIDESKSGASKQCVVVKQTQKTGKLQMVRAGGSKWVGKNGLYGHFVKGEGLDGTILGQGATPTSTREISKEQSPKLDQKPRNKKEKKDKQERRERRERRREKRRLKSSIHG